MNPDTQVSGFNGAEIKNPALGDGLNSMLSSGGTSFFQKIVPSSIGLLFVVGTISFLFMLLWGAVGWILSGGDKASLESAKNKITNAIIGLILMFATFAIVKLIETFFGINILSIDIGPLVIQ